MAVVGMKLLEVSEHVLCSSFQNLDFVTPVTKSFRMT